MKKPKPRTAGVSATEHGRAQAKLEQQQARIEELEEELTSARPGLPSLTWRRAMRFLIDELPYVGSEAEPADWPSEFADMVRQISAGHGVELEELEELELGISRLRAAVAVVREEEPTLAAEESVEAEPAAGSTSGLEWIGDEDDGYLARGLVEGKHPIACTVMPVVFRGCEHFEAKIITDPNADLALSVKKLADRYGAALTRDVVALLPRPRLLTRPRSYVRSLTAAAEGLTTGIVEQRNPAGLLAQVAAIDFPLPRTSPQGLDRPDREINIGYRCVVATRSIVLIGQADFSGAGRSKDLRNNLACNALVTGAHSHHGDDVHFKGKIFHSRPNTAGRPLFRWSHEPVPRFTCPEIGDKQKLNKSSEVGRIVRAASAAKDHERINFFFARTHQDGTTVAACKFDRRIGHFQRWREHFYERRWNDVESLLSKSGHCWPRSTLRN